MFSLLALATGIFADPMGMAFGSVRVMVRHQGPPLPFTLHVRTKETKEAEWTYIEQLTYFPVTLLTSPLGRQVRMQLPAGLKTYSQICSRLAPPEQSQASSFRVLLSVQSCANLPKRNTGVAWDGWAPSTNPGVHALSLLRPVVTPADTNRGHDPA
jgi:hypothetical protein